ncbi:hypothetical protein FN846DRAFT_976947 [Sphaerosporella brunnea]|uniref:Uncharacterized protein n=1 Tax=Sphaerosporella brunnea TaxID=1250544 RepID=A0A5J5EE21_9PEZI|nr:hypothetical protein FN846DRAFT_976947 [Sphaerosporella brunnea]
MAPLTPSDRRLFSAALTLTPAETHSMPAHLLHSGTSSNSSGSCATHAPLNQPLLASLASRLLLEAQLKLPQLLAALALPRLPRKRLPPLLRLARAYSALAERVDRGACVGCAVAAVAVDEDCLFALEAGAKVWRRDRSALERWRLVWAAHASPRFLAETDYVAHAVRRVLRALRRARACVCCAAEPPAAQWSAGVRYSLPGNPFWMPERGVAYVELPAPEKGDEQQQQQQLEDSPPPLPQVDHEAVYTAHREARKGWWRFSV